MFRALPLFSLLFVPSVQAASMDTSFLRQYAQTRRFMSGRPSQPAFALGGQKVLFLRAPPESAEQTLFELDLASQTTRELITPELLLKGGKESLTAEEKARLERQRVTARGLTFFKLSKDGEKVVVGLSGKLYVMALSSRKIQALKTGEGAPIDPQFSPDGHHLAYVRQGDIYALDLASGKERQLTKGATATKTHGLAEFVAQEEMGRQRGYWWSPDSKAIAFQETDTAGVELFRIQDAFHPEKEPDAFPYPRAGKANAKVRLGIVSAQGGAVRWVHWDVEHFPYLASVNWPSKGALTVLVQNRQQQEEALLAVDPVTTKTQRLLTEKDDAWINLDQKFPRWLADGSGFLWLTERNGAPEVELRDASGQNPKSWIPPSAKFRELVDVDAATGTLYFLATVSPVESTLYRAVLGKPPERVLLEGIAGGWVEAELSKDGQRLVILHTSRTQMPRSHVFDVQGRRLGELPSVAQEPPFALNSELKTLPLDKPMAGTQSQWHALVFRPRGKSLSAGQKLPVLLSVYGGPNHSLVRDVMREHLLAQWYADLGFIVVKIDGRGTPFRDRAFERAIRGDFAAITLDDQVAALQALGKQMPELDLQRVVIEGWSFGGYMSALAVLKRPDVFRGAVAGAPVVDWEDYDTHYTERYLGLPQDNPEGYRRSNLLTYAKDLQRPLLLIHGTADDNVYFLHTLKLSDALFKAGRAHEVLPLSGFTHMVPDPLVTERLYERVATFLRAAVTQ